MKYTVSGADRDTGDAMEFTVEAADEKTAREVAHRKGLLVSAVAPAPTPPRAAPSVVAEARRVPAASRPAATTIAPAHTNPSPLEHGHVRGAPTVNVALPRRGSSLGIASMVLGIVALFVCWIPLVNILGIALAGLGLLLGVIGLFVAMSRRGSGIGFPIAGSAICALGLIVAIAMNVLVLGGIASAGRALADAQKREHATNQITAASPTPAASSSTPVPASAPTPASPSDSGGVGIAPSPAPTRTPPAPAHPARNAAPTAPAPAEPAVTWAPADQPDGVRQGDMQVQIVSVKVAKIELEELRDKATSKERLLRVEVRLSNQGSTKKIDYHTWRGRTSFSDDAATLSDNFDNHYKRINFGFATKVVGGTDSGSVYPEASISDVLVFEEPIAKAEELRLELPAQVFGGTGMLRFKIPVSMIER